MAKPRNRIPPYSKSLLSMNSTLLAAHPIRLTPSRFGWTTSGNGPPSGRKLVVTRSCSARLSVLGVTDLRRAAQASLFDAIDASATFMFHRSFRFRRGRRSSLCVFQHPGTRLLEPAYLLIVMLAIGFGELRNQF